MKSQDYQSIMDDYVKKTANCDNRYHFIKTVKNFISHIKFSKISDAEQVYIKIREDFIQRDTPIDFLNKLIEDTLAESISGLDYDQARDMWYRYRRFADDSDFILCSIIVYHLNPEICSLVSKSDDPEIVAKALELINDIGSNGFEGSITGLKAMTLAKLKCLCRKYEGQKKLYRVYDIVSQIDRQAIMA
jgi:hypothetical protein